MKSYSQLENEIANEMWKIWCPVTPTPKIPPEFFQMAKVAIKATGEQFDSLISELIKDRLEKLYTQDGHL